MKTNIIRIPVDREFHQWLKIKSAEKGVSMLKFTKNFTKNLKIHEENEKYERSLFFRI